MRYSSLFVSVAVCFFSGCALQLNPVTREARAVTPAADAAKTVIVPEGMVWLDQPFQPAHGLRFPPGTYVLEAEDADYWYLRSPGPLEFRDFQDGRAVAARYLPGGLMLAKRFSLIPGAGYIDGEGSAKLMIWKLGGDFLAQEGRYWKKTF